MTNGIAKILSKSKWLILFQHLIAILLAAMALDSGETGIVLVYTMIVYWSLTAVIHKRRAGSPSTFDMFIVRWSFILLFFAGLVIYPFIWHIRGLR